MITDNEVPKVYSLLSIRLYELHHARSETYARG